MLNYYFLERGGVFMKKIHIVTDSTADLTEEEILKYGIHVVPLTIQIDNDSYIDGVDLEPEEFLGLMANCKRTSKEFTTSCWGF